MSQLPYQLHYAARLGLFVKMAEKHVGVVGWGGGGGGTNCAMQPGLVSL